MEEFTILSKVAFGFKYLVILAISSESERLFSYNKELITIHRNRMKELLIKSCVFLHQNCKYNTLDNTRNVKNV